MRNFFLFFFVRKVAFFCFEFFLFCYHIRERRGKKQVEKGGKKSQTAYQLSPMICFYSWWFYEILIAIIVASICVKLCVCCCLLLKLNSFTHTVTSIEFYTNSTVSWLINYIEDTFFYISSRNEIFEMRRRRKRRWEKTHLIAIDATKNFITTKDKMEWQ